MLGKFLACRMGILFSVEFLKEEIIAGELVREELLTVAYMLLKQQQETIVLVSNQV